MLVTCVATLVASRLLAAQWPAMAYVAAFAEAAVIGGLADWYAVVAIFGRPLGLPLPHTAIVVRERDRIAERLGSFIQENFLGADVLDARLREIDFVEAARRWMRNPSNAEQIAKRIVAISPFLLDAIEKSGLRDEVLDRLSRRLLAVDAQRAASSILRSPFVSANRHRVLDVALGGVLKILSSPKTLAELRDGMRREMPAVVKLAGGDHAVFRKIVLSIAAYIENVRSDPEHALHREFETLMDKVVEEIESSPEAGQAIARLRDELFAASPVETLGRHAFATVRRLVEEQSETFARSLSAGLAEAMPRAAAMLDVTDDQSSRLNGALRAMIAGAIESRRGEIGDFVAAQVKSWDADEMVALVEDNIGPDLQFIRMNGAVVGGLAGLAIFAISQALGAH
ncbi:DUF445 domain-containing protein [Methylopila sp. M107]|uniref:DUF445 domain-containing protein n=1 Tax=Methylopila sp. M107 TaxID=1101190 RepID=UPI0018CB5BC1|nr:DUF445 domain-containing protein [Methylopila sp. M107]